jgi:hypothetical protein
MHRPIAPTDEFVGVCDPEDLGETRSTRNVPDATRRRQRARVKLTILPARAQIRTLDRLRHA